MVGTAEGESFQGPDGILQVATIWPGFPALEQTAQAGGGGWPQGPAGTHRDREQECIGLGHWTSHGEAGTESERGRGMGPAPPSQKMWADLVLPLPPSSCVTLVRSLHFSESQPP